MSHEDVEKKLVGYTRYLESVLDKDKLSKLRKRALMFAINFDDLPGEVESGSAIVDYIGQQLAEVNNKLTMAKRAERVVRAKVHLAFKQAVPEGGKRGSVTIADLDAMVEASPEVQKVFERRAALEYLSGQLSVDYDSAKHAERNLKHLGWEITQQLITKAKAEGREIHSWKGD